VFFFTRLTTHDSLHLKRRVLIAGDALVSRRLIQSQLVPYGESDIVAEGSQAFEACVKA